MQRLDRRVDLEPVLGELRLVEIDPHGDVALRRRGQRLDDPLVGQDVGRHVDRELRAADDPGVH